MSNLTPITITNVLATDTAFAVRVDDQSEKVFIPGKVSAICNLRVGQVVDALLVANTVRPEKTPWMAAHIVVRDERDELHALIREDLERGAATAVEIAASIGRDEDEVARKLKALAVRGLLARQDIYALSEADFLRDDEV